MEHVIIKSHHIYTGDGDSFWDSGSFCPRAMLFKSQLTLHCGAFRWASVPPDPEHAPQPGWQDHRHAAGDRQLWAPAHAGVTRVPALKGQLDAQRLICKREGTPLSLTRSSRRLDFMFVFSRWMRLLLCFRPTRPKKLLRSPPPLLVFPVSKASVSPQRFIFYVQSSFKYVRPRINKHFSISFTDWAFWNLLHRWKKRKKN